ncbi:MAG: calcium-binding protein [Saprospirales bacterium]|nr:calcium-binding protein [Saprospirales bacterium]
MSTPFTPVKPPKSPDPKRDNRIQDEIVVDAYDDEEVLGSWYVYLEDTLEFPFEAKIRVETAKKGKGTASVQVTIVGMADQDYCGLRCIWFLAQQEGQDWLFYVPVSDITAVAAGKETVQALTDWLYWLK